MWTSDRVHQKTTHHGGGGLTDYFFVEGIHYDATRPRQLPILQLTFMAPGRLLRREPVRGLLSSM
jgi:hypothetical protein